MMSDIKIIVAMHKQYRLPKDEVYYPVHVGAAGKESIGCARDDSGENISAKNPNYCELTGLYWAWKNLKSDYLGLAHYRRYFASKKGGDKWERIATGADIEKALTKADIILPVKRNYFIETNYDQYVHAHNAADLDITREILQEKYPEYVSAFDGSMKRTSGHRFNMFVMRRDLADEYCAWLFDVLFELEKRLDISAYSAYDARVFGFVSERLMDVWIGTKKVRYTEMPVVFMEEINWWKKGTAFLKRKFLNEKYSASF